MFCVNSKLGRDDEQPFRVLLITRASGHPSHWEPSNHRRVKDQEATLRNWVSDYTYGSVDITVLNLEERQDIDNPPDGQLPGNLAEFNLILASSLDRISRGPSLLPFLQVAVNAQVRLIAIQEGFDSSSPNWAHMIAVAAMFNPCANDYMARRLRRARRKAT